MISSADPPRFSLAELSDASGVSKRTIRYYIDKGLVSGPAGRGRAAYYTPHHLEEIELARQLRGKGYGVAEIRAQRTEPAGDVRAGETWRRIHLHPGLELHYRDDAPPFVQQLAVRLAAEADAWLGSVQATADNGG
jgi:DNA-binding transcriptional MerR regulator